GCEVKENILNAVLREDGETVPELQPGIDKSVGQLVDCNEGFTVCHPSLPLHRELRVWLYARPIVQETMQVHHSSSGLTGVPAPLVLPQRALTASLWSPLTSRLSRRGPTVAFRLFQNHRRAAMRWRAVILIQASFAAGCSGRVAVAKIH